MKKSLLCANWKMNLPAQEIDVFVEAIGSASSTATELHWLKSDAPTDPLTTILPRADKHEYYVDHRDGLFYLRTNRDAGAPSARRRPISLV